MNDRKATDILLELEVKLTQIIKFIQNIDFNQKNLMNRIGSLENLYKSNGINQVNNAQPSPQSLIPNLTQTKAPKVTAVLADGSLSKTPETKPSGKVGRPKNKPMDGLIKLTQSVTDDDGKRIQFGMVKIFNEKGDEVTSCRTDVSGRWAREVSPGKYVIEIKRVNPKFEKKFEILVDSSKPSIDLTE